MSKGYDEIAAEVVQEIVKSRGQAIAGVDNINYQKDLIEDLLSDRAVADIQKGLRRSSSGSKDTCRTISVYEAPSGAFSFEQNKHNAGGGEM